MLKLEDIKAGSYLTGIVQGQVACVVGNAWAGDAMTVYYTTLDGAVHSRLLLRADEQSLAVAETGLPWSFDAPGADFKLAAEAYRINLAYLFDPMMAVHTSNVEPLPHQITAVYESMLPRQPLRFVLADDPGAGKTIMAGLYIRELLMRADARRVLVVAPGSLVEQWQDEMRDKFGLRFEIFGNEQLKNSYSGNPFMDHDLMIARMDQLKGRDDLLEKLRLTRWDLVIVDEAHKMSARQTGEKVDETKRYKLGKLLGGVTRHLLLMTATPHDGKDEDFQLFMALLDEDRFWPRRRGGTEKVDVSDLMRRMVKEDLLKFDGTPLFPERRAYTVTYRLSDREADLYASVTEYVKEEMNKADRLENGSRRGTVGFALTALQRRLASSPESIYQSLRRRRDRLKQRVEEEKNLQRGPLSLADLIEGVPRNLDDAEDDLSPEAYEQVEETVVDQATAARTISELGAEIRILDSLVDQAREVVESGQDRKWEELSKLLQNTPEMRDKQGRQRKLIIFTEHKDTLSYLVKQVRGVLGSSDAVVFIHGGVDREQRREIQGSFRNDPVVRVLVATDAAGEGVNLQAANLMVNYDLPWNPNRIEQRFGRIHRIGQTEVCHLWNMVAAQTREGDVFQRLFEKLETERKSLGGRVFDILGDVFEDKSLKDLLIEAIRYGEDPERQARLLKKVEGALDPEHLRDIIQRNALCEEILDKDRLYAVKEEMEKAEARKLQPYFVRSFFAQAFRRLGGDLRDRETGRYEISHVPASIRERDRQLCGPDRRSLNPVVTRYERICFEKQYVSLTGRNAPMAELVHPGHPLMRAVIDLTLEAHRAKLKSGCVLIDHADDGVEPRVMFVIEHSVNESDGSRAASRRLHFVAIDAGGEATNGGWAPYLDYEPVVQEDLDLIQDVLKQPWLIKGLEQRALEYAATNLVQSHLVEVRGRRAREVSKTLAAVTDRLVREIDALSDREERLKQQLASGKDVRLTLENTRHEIDEIRTRLDVRTKELEAMRNVAPATPAIVGGALVIPAGLLAKRRGTPGWSADAAARSRIERVAMEAVMAAERALGNDTRDVSADKCGWDVTSTPKAVDGALPPSRHIEVKGRAKGQTSVTVTRNEILYGLNQADKFLLAIVLVEGDSFEGPFYVRNPFIHEPDWAVTSINLDLAQLLTRAESR